MMKPSCADELVGTDPSEIAGWGAAALALTAIAFLIIERRTRRRWSTLPLERRVVGGAYREASVVTAHRERAPVAVRAAAAIGLAFACAVVPCAAFAWTAFDGCGGLIALAALSAVALGYAGLALLVRAANAEDVARFIGIGSAAYFVVVVLVAASRVAGGSACVRFGVGTFSVEGAALAIALAFAPVWVALQVALRSFAETHAAAVRTVPGTS